MHYFGWDAKQDETDVNTEYGYERMVDMIMEDEEWARVQFEAFHGREY